MKKRPLDRFSRNYVFAAPSIFSSFLYESPPSNAFSFFSCSTGSDVVRLISAFRARTCFANDFAGRGEADSRRSYPSFSLCFAVISRIQCQTYAKV